MKRHHQHNKRQDGAIAIIVGLCIFVLMAMMGLSLDLGHTYIAKTELQNATDAAALAAAKQLNQTAAGVTAAVNAAATIAARHNYNFSTPITITADNVRVGSCPNAANGNSFGRPSLRTPSCNFVAASSITTDAAASGKTYVEIDTGNRAINTFFMRAVSAAFNQTSTAGYAVAGRFLSDVTPLGVCAIDPANKTAKYTYPGGMTELVEFGFRRGVTYNLFELNPLSAGPSDPYLLNPVDVDTACDASHSSANFTAPFMCNGSSAVGGLGKVYTNTGLTTKLEASLNSRFGTYTGPSVCNPSDSPPDSNVKEYPCNSNTNAGCVNNASKSPPTDWMEPGATTQPNRESVLTASGKPIYSLPGTSSVPNVVTNPSSIFTNYGVLWSYGPPYQADASTPPKLGSAITPAQANGSVMYDQAGTQYFNMNNSGGVSKYPVATGTGFPAGTPAAPYNQTSGTFFQAPSKNGPGVKNRRILKVVLVDCSSPPVGPASCGAMNSVGLAAFFMQVPADINKKNIFVEFAGLTEAKPFDEIKLYR